MKLSPFILGSGLSGQTISRALALIQGMDPRFEFPPVTWVRRGCALSDAIGQAENPLLFIANPHGLHASALLEARELPLKGIFCEKPACTSLEDVQRLRAYPKTVAIYHGYRATWGAKTLKSLAQSGELGQIFAVTGRYWQSSTAEKALEGTAKDGWKNYPGLSGPFDVLLDLATHWLDLAASVVPEPLRDVRVWKSFANAEAAHRDSHVHLTLDFPSGAQAMGSISKTAHGFGNALTLEVLGTRASAEWAFQNPDEIIIGQGRNRRVVSRKEKDLGTKSPPFHAMGWIEGYVEITHQALKEMVLGETGEFPRLEESLNLLEKLLAHQSLPKQDL